jgi:hypothetical protein
VIPAFKVRDHILAALAGIGPRRRDLRGGRRLPREHRRARAQELRGRARARDRVERRLGVGGATARGYPRGSREEMDILVKLHADGRMDPARLPAIMRPLVEGQADYAKGNRFSTRTT